MKKKLQTIKGKLSTKNKVNMKLKLPQLSKPFA